MGKRVPLNDSITSPIIKISDIDGKRSCAMKAIRQFFAGIALAIPLLGVGVWVWVWRGGSSVIGGNVIVDRPMVDSTQ